MLRRYDNILTAMRRHSVEPTVFVLAKDENEKLNIMAAGWNVKCSYDPPMMAVALSRDGNTHKLIQRTGEFVLAVPNPEHGPLLEYVGSVSGVDTDKFAERMIPTQAASEISVPLLSEARANFECRVASIVPTGDHFLIIGEVLAAHYDVDRNQLYFAGRDSYGNRVYDSISTHFPDDIRS